MIKKRIIPCLDVKNGRVVKGVNFEGLSDVSSPVELAAYYSDHGADELVFYDITASAEGRALFTDILCEVASKIFIPLTVGGGINTLDDFDRVLKCGADKVSVNSGAIRNPELISDAAKRYGDQCVVISADVKRVDGVFRVFAKGGRENTGMEAIEWIRRCVGNGEEAMEKTVDSRNLHVQKKKKTAIRAVVYTLLAIWALIVLFPFYWMLLTSFKSYGDYNAESVPQFITLSPTLENYFTAFT